MMEQAPKMTTSLATLTKSMRGTLCDLMRHEKRMAKQRDGVYVPTVEMTNLSRAIIFIETGTPSLSDVKLALQYVDDIECGAFGDADGVIKDDGQMPETTARLKAYRAALNDMFCAITGHDFPNQVVFKRRTGLDEPHCSRCGLLFSEFKQQVKAVIA